MHSLTGTVTTCLFPSSVLTRLGRSLKYNPDRLIVYPSLQSSACKSSNVLQHLIASVRRRSSAAPPKTARSFMTPSKPDCVSSILGRPRVSRSFSAAAKSVFFSKSSRIFCFLKSRLLLSFCCANLSL